MSFFSLIFQVELQNNIVDTKNIFLWVGFTFYLKGVHFVPHRQYHSTLWNCFKRAFSLCLSPSFLIDISSHYRQFKKNLSCRATTKTSLSSTLRSETNAKTSGRSALSTTDSSGPILFILFTPGPTFYRNTIFILWTRTLWIFIRSGRFQFYSEQQNMSRCRLFLFNFGIRHEITKRENCWQAVLEYFLGGFETFALLKIWIHHRWKYLILTNLKSCNMSLKSQNWKREIQFKIHRNTVWTSLGARTRRIQWTEKSQE